MEMLPKRNWRSENAEVQRKAAPSRRLRPRAAKSSGPPASPLFSSEERIRLLETVGQHGSTEKLLKEHSKVRKIAFVADYLPRKCGCVGRSCIMLFRK